MSETMLRTIRKWLNFNTVLFIGMVLLVVWLGWITCTGFAQYYARLTDLYVASWPLWQKIVGSAALIIVCGFSMMTLLFRACGGIFSHPGEKVLTDSAGYLAWMLVPLWLAPMLVCRVDRVVDWQIVDWLYDGRWYLGGINFVFAALVLWHNRGPVNELIAEDAAESVI